MHFSLELKNAEYPEGSIIISLWPCKWLNITARRMHTVDIPILVNRFIFLEWILSNLNAVTSVYIFKVI